MDNEERLERHLKVPLQNVDRAQAILNNFLLQISVDVDCVSTKKCLVVFSLRMNELINSLKEHVADAQS